MASPTTPSPEAPASANSFGRIFGALFSPKETFESIAQRRTWLAPLIVLTLINFAMNLMLANKADWKAVAQEQLENNRRVTSLSPDQHETAVNQAAMGQKISTYV
jgi:hypothetical protein